MKLRTIILKDMKDTKNNLNYENKVNTDKIDINTISKIRKTMLGQSKCEKTFFKSIFKVYEKSLESFKEENFSNLTKFIDCREIEKIALALKYKTGLNYREKIKIVKELTKDFSVDYFFSLEYIITTYWNDLMNAQCNKKNLPNLDINDNISEKDKEELFFEQFSILLNTVTLIKCIKYNYYKYNILEFDSKGNFKKSITPNKIAFTTGPIFSIGNMDYIDEKDIYSCIKAMPYEIINSRNKLLYSVISVIGLISRDEVTEDLYSKVVLKEEYNKTVSNRIHNPSEVTPLTFNMHDFLRRKVLLPKNGVILLIKDNPLIESILLKERMNDYYNNLIVVTRYKDGREMINTLLIKEWEYSTDEKHINVNMMEEHYSCPTTVDYVTSFFEMYDKDYYKYNIDYEVIAPYYWKYRDRNYKSDKDVVNHKGVIIKREYSVDIAPFIRKINGVPSKEAINLSKKLGVILEDGYTIVKPHTRTYNKVETHV